MKEQPEPIFFAHQCEAEGCERVVQYNDEPCCFRHSPDEGSFTQGYSASAKARARKPGEKT